ncbi:MAG: Asp-tRNA(Asn)/Glu-tRNA(Gln) amidotransferase subunit GatA [Chloroflexi bacterium]|nr:Asp-tRNA(Asn)/Glu-tRNA(Gln) amidotransferase subunit GatA [Chloroflexota bacterium]
MPKDLTDLSIREARHGLRNGDFSAVALTQSYLERIQQLDPQVGAYLHVAEDLALEMADEADQQHSSGQDLPLLGIPIAIKDVLNTRDMATTCGSRILEGYIPSYNATAVQRLIDAGAVILGKTNTDEFAMGSSTENSAYHPTRNPWDTARVPGGSSGGSAAAVAARLAAGALGTDTGGSVRQPAAFCGVAAIKPSYGRVSRYGLTAFASSLDCVGTFGRTIEDAALLLQIIAGHDLRDSTSMDVPVPPYGEIVADDVKGMRIGVPREYFVEGLQPAVEDAVRQALDTFLSLGVEVREISMPHTAYALSVYYLLAPAEASANLARYDGVRYGKRETGPTLWDTYRRTRGQGFGPEVKRRIMLGTYALSAGYYDAYYLRAQKVRTLIKADFDAAFEQVDAIVSPTAPTTAFKLNERVNDPLQMYLSDVLTLPASLAGIGGLSIPCGYDEDQLPIGLQIMSPFFQEEKMLRVASAYQRATNWHQRIPVL